MLSLALTVSVIFIIIMLTISVHIASRNKGSPFTSSVETSKLEKSSDYEKNTKIIDYSLLPYQYMNLPSYSSIFINPSTPAQSECLTNIHPHINAYKSNDTTEWFDTPLKTSHTLRLNVLNMVHAIPLIHCDQAAWHAMIPYWIAGLTLLLIVQHLILKYTLHPLEEAKQQLQALQSGDIKRLNEDIAYELIPLVKQINNLLGSLEQRIERSRKALGNLTHALKTPLAVLIQLSHDKIWTDNTRLMFVHKTTEIQTLIDRELKRARLSGRSQFGHSVSVERDIRQLTETLQLIYQSRNIIIRTLTEPDARFYGDNQDFMELLGNLSDNACKWAKSLVKITVQGQNPLELTIEDDGPGIGQQQSETLLKRGSRLDERQCGSGLGLSIVKDIIDLYHGTIHFDRSPELGGLRVQITIGKT